MENGLNRLPGDCEATGAARGGSDGGDGGAPTRRRIGLARSMPELFAERAPAAGRADPGGAHWLPPGPGRLFPFTKPPRDPVPALGGAAGAWRLGPEGAWPFSLPCRPLKPSATLRTRLPRACNSSLDNASIQESSGRVASRFNSSTCCSNRSRSLTPQTLALLLGSPVSTGRPAGLGGVNGRVRATGPAPSPARRARSPAHPGLWRSTCAGPPPENSRSARLRR